MNVEFFPRFIESELRSPVLSLVVPFYNERPVLSMCLQRLCQVADALEVPYELIFVDDGSQDGGAEYLATQTNTCSTLKVVRLSRNFGKEAAITAGLDYAKGGAVILLDADLQDPPELIPAMLAAWHDGADVVLMRRRSRAGETVLKRLSAYLFYRLLYRVCDHDIPTDVGDFRLMSRRAVDALRLLPERNRYTKGLFAWVGMETRVIEYDRAPRAGGTSKWNYLSLFGLAIEGITSFSIKPLRWATLMGVGAALVGGLFGLWIVFKAMFLGESVQGFPSLMAVITFLGGAQLLTVGILGEYVGKTYLEAKQRPIYLVQDVINQSPSRSRPIACPRAEVVADE